MNYKTVRSAKQAFTLQCKKRICTTTWYRGINRLKVHKISINRANVKRLAELMNYRVDWCFADVVTVLIAEKLEQPKEYPKQAIIAELRKECIPDSTINRWLQEINPEVKDTYTLYEVVALIRKAKRNQKGKITSEQYDFSDYIDVEVEVCA
jgi:hypothetical protein